MDYSSLFTSGLRVIAQRSLLPSAVGGGRASSPDSITGGHSRTLSLPTRIRRRSVSWRMSNPYHSEAEQRTDSTSTLSTSSRKRWSMLSLPASLSRKVSPKAEASEVTFITLPLYIHRESDDLPSPSSEPSPSGESKSRYSFPLSSHFYMPTSLPSDPAPEHQNFSRRSSYAVDDHSDEDEEYHLDSEYPLDTAEWPIPNSDPERDDWRKFHQSLILDE